MKIQYNDQLQKLFRETGRDTEPFRNMMTYNARERSECVDMLADMGISVIPMSNLAETLTEVL